MYQSCVIIVYYLLITKCNTVYINHLCSSYYLPKLVYLYLYFTNELL